MDAWIKIALLSLIFVLCSCKRTSVPSELNLGHEKYTLLPIAYRDRKCGPKINTTSAVVIKAGSPRRRCDAVIERYHQMFYGTELHFFPSGTENAPVYRQIMQFTCNASSTIPDELIITKEDGSINPELIAASRIGFVREFSHRKDANFTQKIYPLIVNAARMGIRLNATQPNIFYLMIRVELEIVQFKRQIMVQEAYQAFDNLPLVMRYGEYNDYAEKFGTGLITKAALGGVLHLVYYPNSESQVVKLRRMVENDRRSVIEKAEDIYKLIGNGLGETRYEGGLAGSSPSEWLRLLDSHKILIPLQVTPMYELMPSDFPSRNRHLHVITHKRIQNNEIRLDLFLLKSIRNDVFSDFLQNLLLAVVDRICILSDIRRKIHSDLFTDNYDGYRYGLTIDRKFSSLDDKEEEKIHQLEFGLIGDVCVTTFRGLFTGILRAEFKYTPGVNCMQFFHQQECKGTPQILYSGHDLRNREYEGIVSFAFCQPL